MKTIIIAGASGLVGSNVLKNLRDDLSIEKIVLLVRKKMEVNDLRIVQLIVDFDKLENLNLASFGISAIDAAICTLGTTIKKAGSKVAFRRVDLDYVVAFANLSKSLEVKHFLVVSALGANRNSSIFYNQIKGEMEESLRALGFKRLTIIRPSLLLGERKEKRIAEKFFIKISPILNRTFLGPLKKYRGVEVHKVATFLTSSLKSFESGIVIIENDQLLNI